jgi:hypothetical protein
MLKVAKPFLADPLTSEQKVHVINALVLTQFFPWRRRLHLGLARDMSMEILADKDAPPYVKDVARVCISNLPMWAVRGKVRHAR